MNTLVLGLLAETSIHPGAGRSLGVVDLPVAREAGTDYPVLVGSSLKGALRDKAEKKHGKDSFEIKRFFGEQDKAGEILVSDGRLLLLPVRSLTGAYKWVTCPHILERFARDLKRAGLKSISGVSGTGKTTDDPGRSATLEKGHALGRGPGDFFLEERQFSLSGGVSKEILEAISYVVPYEKTRDRLKDQVVVLHDDDFAWFARYGLCVQARNVLEKDTKKSKNLWYEETLPSDTLMYTLVFAPESDALEWLKGLFSGQDAYLQAGGNETIGQGWFGVQVKNA